MKSNLLLVCILFAPSSFAQETTSFAQEYYYLSKLLENVTDQASAIAYKSEILKELHRLKFSQLGGSENFASLSDSEKEIFIQKFQNNRNHCRYVTKVMKERNRILLNSNTKKELESVLFSMP